MNDSLSPYNFSANTMDYTWESRLFSFYEMLTDTARSLFLRNRCLSFELSGMVQLCHFDKISFTYIFQCSKAQFCQNCTTLHHP